MIGDPNQAIYGFRGADTACFERFAQDFPNAETVRLEPQLPLHRRHRRGLGEAGRHGRGRHHPAHAEPVGAACGHERGGGGGLRRGHDRGASGRPRHARGQPGQARRQGGGRRFSDFAVLYRTDAQSPAFRTAFDRAGIPFKKSSPAPIAGHAGVTAMLEALGAENEAPMEPNLQKRLATAVEAARRAGADAAALAEAKGWLTALARSDAVQGDATMLLEQVALSTEADFRDARADRVSLLTMHAAKGLEFAVVFVVGWRTASCRSPGGSCRRQPRRRRGAPPPLRPMHPWPRKAVPHPRPGAALAASAVRTRRPSPFLADIASEREDELGTPGRKRQQQLKLF